MYIPHASMKYIMILVQDLERVGLQYGLGISQV